MGFCYDNIALFFLTSELCAKNYIVLLSKIILNHLSLDNLWLGHSSSGEKKELVTMWPTKALEFTVAVILGHSGTFYTPGQCILVGFQEGETHAFIL